MKQNIVMLIKRSINDISGLNIKSRESLLELRAYITTNTKEPNNVLTVGINELGSSIVDEKFFPDMKSSYSLNVRVGPVRIVKKETL
jgi:hypothetical protein